MTKWKKVTKSFVTFVVLLGSILVGVSMLPAETALADTVLQNDMAVLYVYPSNITAEPGKFFTASVRFYNLTGKFYMGADSPPGAPQWEAGEPLPPPGTRFNYSLGNLYAFEVGFSWDPSLLEYQNHTVKVPVETYADGVLHEPVIDVEEKLDTDYGTYLVAKTSFLADPFSTDPGGNATVFDMTFKVKKFGKCYLNITSSDLAIGLALDGFEDCYAQIPHWTANSIFQTETLISRLESIETGGYDNNTFFNPPVISGEDAMVKTAVVNDGSITDTYNLTLSSSGSLLKEWWNETLEPGERKAFNQTIDNADLSVGTHNVTAKIDVSHGAFNFTEEVTHQFRVIGPPELVIQGPSTAIAGNVVDYTSASSHTDPDGILWNYTWTLTAPGETGSPRETIETENASFELHYLWSGGNWTVELEVKDNYGLEYNKDRPLTAAYRITKILLISEKGTVSFWDDPENIAVVVGLIIIIAVAIVYLRRRNR